MAVHTLASARGALEAARGTPVTATRILYFAEASHTQEVGTLIPEEMRASFTPYRRAYAGLQRNTMRFSGDATYEQLVWWANLALDTEASGSVVDTSAYTWTFLPVHTSDALKSATVEFAWTDLLSVVGWKLPGCIANRFAMTFTKPVDGGDVGVSWEVDLMSAYGATQITAFTGSLSDVAMTSAIGNNTKTYINATASAFGTTADTRVNQATFEVTNGYVYRDGFDGTGNAIEIVRTDKRRSRLTMQRYFNDKTELDAYIAKTTRRIRVINEGAVVGAATAKNTIQLDFAGIPSGHESTDVDGLVYANLEFAPIEDSSITSDIKLTVINSLSAIT